MQIPRPLIALTALACLCAAVSVSRAAEIGPLRFWPKAVDGPDALGSGGRYAVVLLRSRQFDSLERGIAEIGKLQIRLEDGRTRLEAVHFALNQAFEEATGTDAVALADIEAWKQEMPNSVAAPIVEAIAWRSRGWAARGTTTSNGVAVDGWQLFNDKLTKAETVLRVSKTRSDSNPLWYAESMIVARGLGRSADAFQALYAEGIKKYPSYEELHRQMLMYLSPQWGGSYKAMSTFIERTADALPAGDSSAMYARLFWQVREMQHLDGQDIFAKALASWPRLKSGFSELAKSHPGSAWILNAFASFACSAGDAATYANVRHQIGASVFEEAWTASFPVEVCDRRFNIESADKGSIALPPTGFQGMRRPATLDGIGGSMWVGLSFAHELETAHYGLLESRLKDAATLKDRLDDGSTWLESADQGLYWYFQDARFSDAIEQSLRKWREQDPGSSAAPIVEAIFWRAGAWRAQGDHDAGRRSAAGEKIFREKLQRAEAALRNSRQTSATNPLWHYEYLLTARGLGWKSQRIRVLFEDAVAQFPQFTPLYQVMATTLAPRWGGSYAAVEKFAVSVDRQRQADLGHSLYTSIYQHITFVAEPGFDLFRDTTISWPLAKQGFDDMMLRNPKSFWNLNAYAILACMAKDRDSYQRVRPKLGNMIYTMLWPSNRSIVVCDSQLLGTKTP